MLTYSKRKEKKTGAEEQKVCVKKKKSHESDYTDSSESSTYSDGQSDEESLIGLVNEEEEFARDRKFVKR